MKVGALFEYVMFCCYLRNLHYLISTYFLVVCYLIHLLLYKMYNLSMYKQITVVFTLSSLNVNIAMSKNHVIVAAPFTVIDGSTCCKLEGIQLRLVASRLLIGNRSLDYWLLRKNVGSSSAGCYVFIPAMIASFCFVQSMYIAVTIIS